MLFHLIIFLVLIFLQYEVYNVYNMRSALKNFFDIDPLSSNSSYVKDENYPHAIINRLAKLLQDNSFWFLDRKYDVITNVRITQRVSKLNQKFTTSLILDDEIKQKLLSTRSDAVIDVYSSYDELYETKELLSNGYNYTTQNCKNKFFIIRFATILKSLFLSYIFTFLFLFKIIKLAVFLYRESVIL